MKLQLSRRELLTAFGAALFSCGWLGPVAEAVSRQRSLFASPYVDKTGKHGVAVIDQDGGILVRHPLPERGHSCVSNQASPWLVTFARRPGNFALAIDVNSKHVPHLFKTPPHSHFYGHGVFSQNGSLLFATENEFESGKGLIGIYDATDNFNRIGEFASHGIGPHETVLMTDGFTLCVANGGILTHPDTGQTKLNLHEMQSSIAFIDSRSGELLEMQEVPDVFSRLSLRHMAVDGENAVWLGGQYEGYSSEPVPLIATAKQGRGLEFPEFATIPAQELANYIGSVASNPSRGEVAFTSPRGGAMLVIDTKRKIVARQVAIDDVCGVSRSQTGFLTSSMDGSINQQTSDLHWDNHLSKINPDNSGNGKPA